MNPQDIASLGKRYLWWKSAEDVAAHPMTLIAQIMDIGTWDDVVALEQAITADQLRDVLAHAEPGQFSPKSWQFWHLRLHLADIDNVPPLPQRSFQ